MIQLSWGTQRERGQAGAIDKMDDGISRRGTLPLLGLAALSSRFNTRVTHPNGSICTLLHIRLALTPSPPFLGEAVRIPARSISYTLRSHQRSNHRNGDVSRPPMLWLNGGSTPATLWVTQILECCAYRRVCNSFATKIEFFQQRNRRKVPTYMQYPPPFGPALRGVSAWYR